MRTENAALLQIEKANANDQEATAKYGQAIANYGQAIRKLREAQNKTQELSATEREKAEAEYKNEEVEYSHRKENIRKRKARTERTRKEAEAAFQKAEREFVKEPQIPDQQLPGLQIGVDINLIFYPSKDIGDTTRIRLIKFKCPMLPDQKSTEEGWSVDANSGDIYLYFGWNNNDEPRRPGNKYNAGMQHYPPPNKPRPGSGKKSNQRNGDVNVRNSLDPRLQSDYQVNPGDEKFVRGILRELKGTRLAEEGMKASETNPAYIVDTPREICSRPREALFATYACDLHNSTWLGGVSWGYYLRESRESDGQLYVGMHRLKVRSNGSLLSAEGESRALRMHDRAPEGCIPVPPDDISA